MSVFVIVVDGVRPDTLALAVRSGCFPALARLAAEGSSHTVCSVFPSVTGIAYVPFLFGRHPLALGLPGLRWFDRSRSVGRLGAHTRSYVGPGLRHMRRDLALDAPDLFDLVSPSLAAVDCVGRGVRRGERIGASPGMLVRATMTHLRGDVDGWLDFDRAVARTLTLRARRERPEFVFAAFMGVDKVSHLRGHASPHVATALAIVDDAIGVMRRDAERDGRWRKLQIWVVSDHGHSPVTQHDNLADVFRDAGLHVLSHPWVIGSGHDIAVMVSGNAMAHLYLEPHRKTRAFWPALSARWSGWLDELLCRESVDIALVPHESGCSAVHGRGRGMALVQRDAATVSYLPLSGDPLGLGEQLHRAPDDAFDIARESDYPDVLWQVVSACASERSGDVVLSASRGWDFRSRFEPIPHVSSHGGLLREQMLVPFLSSGAVARAPRRTVDVMPSVLAALGRGVPPGLDGASFLRGAPPHLAHSASARQRRV